MKNLRRWKLGTTSPTALQLAADARLSATDYSDDQVWELSLGSGESPALVLQTRYGGRAGLASLVPMWFHDGRVIYQAQTYAKPPMLTGFAPGYLRTQATLTPQLALQAEYWAMASHAIGGQFTLSNAHVEPTTVRLDLFGHVGIGGKEQPLSILTLQGAGHALHMGKVGNLNPVVLMEDGSADTSEPISPKIGRTLSLAGRKKIIIRWVHAGLPDVRDSLALAQYWLQQDWAPHFQRIEAAAQAIPNINTGDDNLDATIAFSYQQLVQAFLKPTANLPYASLVATRQPGRGFSPRGDGADYERGWGGQSPTLAYTATLAMAPVDPQLAQGVVRNYLAVQSEDGWIDSGPGLGGQRQGTMCTPLLARLAWSIFQYTEDTQFLAETFPGLVKFFLRWFQADLDTDQDGLPEWQDLRQTGYVYLPTFTTQPWGQGLDIRLAETPDMAAYLLSEALSLREIARHLRKKQAENRLNGYIVKLRATLESLWHDRYQYRDRDTHATTNSIVVLEEGRGDMEYHPAQPLTPPSRLLVYVLGGVDHEPRVTVHLQGLDANGQPISESAGKDAFTWGRGRGIYTSQNVFAQVDHIRFDDLSRVYRVRVQTPDLTRTDINALLPLWSAGIPPERADALVNQLTDTNQFWRRNGVTMCPAGDPDFDPANADGCGGVWPFWVTLIGEGLIEYNHTDKATDLLKRFLHAQVAVLKQQKAFAEFYHSDQPLGLGEHGHVGGIVPLHLLLRVLGVRIISSGKVWTGGPFTWGKAVTIRQYGVTVRRTSKNTQIRFPSGYEVELANDGWREVADPQPLMPEPLAPLDLPPPPKAPPTPPSARISIQVQHDDDPD